MAHELAHRLETNERFKVAFILLTLGIAGSVAVITGSAVAFGVIASSIVIAFNLIRMWHRRSFSG